MFRVGTDLQDKALAEVLELAGVMAYGADRAEAVARVQALALQVLADKLEHGELAPVPSVTFSQPEAA